MTIAEGGLDGIVGKRHQLYDNITAIGLSHQRGVFVAMLIVCKDADIAHALQFQVIKDILRCTLQDVLLHLGIQNDELVGRDIGIGLWHRTEVSVEGRAIETSFYIIRHLTVHVAKEETAHLDGEQTHIEHAVRQTIVCHIVIEVIGISHEGWLAPINSTTSATATFHIHISQLMDIILHRQG